MVDGTLDWNYSKLWECALICKWYWQRLLAISAMITLRSGSIILRYLCSAWRANDTEFDTRTIRNRVVDKGSYFLPKRDSVGWSLRIRVFFLSLVIPYPTLSEPKDFRIDGLYRTRFSCFATPSSMAEINTIPCLIERECRLSCSDLLVWLFRFDKSWNWKRRIHGED